MNVGLVSRSARAFSPVCIERWHSRALVTLLTYAWDVGFSTSNFLRIQQSASSYIVVMTVALGACPWATVKL